MKRNTLLLTSLRASAVMSIGEASIVMWATQIKPGFFNEHVTLEITHADAVRLYLWLGEVVGKEVQP